MAADRMARALGTTLAEKFAKAERKLPGKGERRASRLCDESHRRRAVGVEAEPHACSSIEQHVEVNLH